MDIIFNKKPFLTMSEIFKYPELKTIAFGGVATGNINAHDAAKVADTIKIKGCKSSLNDTAAKIGRNSEIVAILEVTSVKKFTKETKRIIIMKKSKYPKFPI